MSDKPRDDATTIISAALIIIGNEILSGRTKDANLPYIAQTLNEVGVRLLEARIVPDIEVEIVSAVNALRRKYHYVFTTGGIGPTHDDITAECVAKAFGQALVRHPEAYSRLRKHYAETGLELTAARLRMANTPERATLIDNPISSAPGFRIENVFVMAGVPKIMRAMLDSVKGELKGGLPMRSRVILSDLGEGTIAAGLEDVQKRYPQVDIGSYPRFTPAAYRVSVVLRHTDTALLEAVCSEVCAMLQTLGGAPRLANSSKN